MGLSVSCSAPPGWSARTPNPAELSLGEWLWLWGSVPLPAQWGRGAPLCCRLWCGLQGTAHVEMNSVPSTLKVHHQCCHGGDLR